jgi:hypothetical protein
MKTKIIKEGDYCELPPKLNKGDSMSAYLLGAVALCVLAYFAPKAFKKLKGKCKKKKTKKKVSKKKRKTRKK